MLNFNLPWFPFNNYPLIGHIPFTLLSAMQGDRPQISKGTSK
jgi:hypothetical protein